MLSKYRSAGDGQELSEDDVRDIIKVFYPDEAWPQTIDINDDVVESVWTMVQASRSCSRAMDFVPRPVGWKPGAFFIVKSLYSLAKALTGKSAAEKRNIYSICRSVTAGNWKQDLMIKGGY